MYCWKCGKQIPEEAVFCGHCGERQQPDQARAHYGGAPQGSDLYGAPGVPMAWFKFIIYFQLIANAVLNVLNAANLLTGTIYDGWAEYVYSMFGGLRVLDTGMAVVCLLLAGFAIFVRQRLAHFRVNACGLYFSFLIANIVFNVLYIIAASFITGLPVGDLVDLTSTTSIIISVAMLAGNLSYFDKRKHLFVN